MKKVANIQKAESSQFALDQLIYFKKSKKTRSLKLSYKFWPILL